MTTVKRSHHYKVTKQELGTEYNADGTVSKKWTVHVEHADGTKGTVEMPDPYYTAPNVHAAIMDQANSVHEVGNLPESVSHLPIPPPTQS